MTDLLIDNDGNVSLTPGYSLLHHQRDVLIAEKGWHKFAPTAGVGLQHYLLDHVDPARLEGAMRVECQRIDLPATTVAYIADQFNLTNPAQ